MAINVQGTEVISDNRRIIGDELRISKITNEAGSGSPEFPNNLQVDEITNAAGTGPPSFPAGLPLVNNSIVGFECSNSGSGISITPGQTIANFQPRLIETDSTLFLNPTTTGAQGLESGFSMPSDGTVHIHVIGDSSGQSPTSVIGSNDPVNPNFPSGYDISRRIFSWPTTSSGNFFTLSVKGGLANIKDYIFSGCSPYTSPGNKITFALPVPTGIEVNVQLLLTLENDLGSAVQVIPRDENFGSTGNDSNNYCIAADISVKNAPQIGSAQVWKITNTQGNVGIRVTSGSEGTPSGSIIVTAWYDFRERII